MPTHIFLALDHDKRRKIIDAGISDFAQYGYNNSSTNRIVKNSGISKGSLFKYFKSKEELYFYVLDEITMELKSDLEKKVEFLPTDLYQRVMKYSEAEFIWYMRHPLRYRIILNAFSKNDTEIYYKTEARYNLSSQDIYYKLLENIDSSQLKWDKKMTIDILKWFLNGFNEEFRSSVQGRSNAEIDSIKDEYVKRLSEHMELLKTGLAK